MAAKRVAVKLSTEGVSRTLFRRRRRHEVGAKAEILTDSTWRVEPDVRKARKIAKENPAQIRWRVTDYQDGQRRRFFFPTEAQALDKVQVASIRRENLGARVANLDGRLIEDAVEAHKMLEPFGVSLLTQCGITSAAPGQLRKADLWLMW
jgi:hypothetical protein